MKSSAVRAILSTVLILALAALVFTGALLYFGKTGVVWGISRSALRSAHFAAAVAMCLFAAVHLFLNRRAYLAELRALSKGSGKHGERRGDR